MADMNPIEKRNATTIRMKIAAALSAIAIIPHTIVAIGVGCPLFFCARANLSDCTPIITDGIAKPNDTTKNKMHNAEAHIAVKVIK